MNQSFSQSTARLLFLVAVALSAEKPRQAYIKFKAVFDRAAGAVMTVLGLKLIFGMK